MRSQCKINTQLINTLTYATGEYVLEPVGNVMNDQIKYVPVSILIYYVKNISQIDQ